MELLTDSYDSDAYYSAHNPQCFSLGHAKALLGFHLKLHR